MILKLAINRSYQENQSGAAAKFRPPFARIVISTVIAALTVSSAQAQTDAQRISELERKLKNALNVIDKLSDKVDKMESGKKAATVPKAQVETSRQAEATPKTDAAPALATTAPPEDDQLGKIINDQNSRISAVQQQVTQLSTAASTRLIPFDWLHGFADVGGAYNSSGHPSGFGIGNLDLYMTPKLGGQVRSLVELVFEYDRVGTLGTDMERAQIGYTFSDQANVWLGRFHTPYGYWQTAFHHGAQIQPSLLRPRFIDFEDKGGILPAHTTGVWGTGGILTDGGKFTYDLYVGNSYNIIPNSALGNGNLGNLDQNAGGFNNSTLTTGAKLSYIFSSGLLDGLNIGVHGFRSQANIMNNNNYNTNPTSSATALVDLNMAGGYFYYNNYDWEIISEGYAFMNEDITGNSGSHKSWAAFIHAGYALGKWMPYARLENVNTSRNDPYFNALAYGYAYAREAAGMRYDINTQSALKLELDYTQPQNNPTNPLRDFWESHLQYAVRF